MSAAQKGHRETHLATAGQKLQALQAKTFMRQRLWPRGEEEGQAGQEGCPPGAAIEVDFEVAAPAISVIISVIIAIIIINAVTRSCLASGAASPSSSLSLLLHLLLFLIIVMEP